MKKNISKTDKIIRITGGIVIMILGIYYQNWLGFLGFILLAVAFIGWCPIYTLLGIDKCPVPEPEKEIEQYQEEKKD